MAGIALVLSGGGAKGAFQLTAEKYARTVKDYRWDIIAGVSVGALNGSLLAMEKYDRLEEIWRNISPRQVFTGKMNFWGYLKLAFGAKSILGHKPLWELIKAEVDTNQIKVDLRIGTVSLLTGEYEVFKPSDYGFPKAVLASTAIPLIWPPVDVSPNYRNMVDGGVRNISPLGDVLDTDPEEIVIINCSPQTPPSRSKPFKNGLEIARHALDIALNEIFVTDLREFLRINQNVKEAEACDCKLHNEKGKEYKFYKNIIIEPEKPLDDTLDFSPEAIGRSMEHGWNRAKGKLD